MSKDQLQRELDLGVEGARELMDGVPNWLVQLSNLAMVLAGSLLIPAGGLVMALGIALAVVGALGIIERVVREVKQRW